MSPAQLAPAVTIDEYYELRLYHMLPTRMPDFHDLMSVKVPPIFARNGIAKPLGFWEGFAGPIAPLYAYIIPWRNLDDRMQAWKRFYADPEWTRQLTANYAGQQRLDRSSIFILRPSPVWSQFKTPAAPDPVGGIHEMRIYDLLNHDPNQAHTALAETDLPFLTARGARVLGVFSTWFGTRMNQAIIILAWPDAATMQRAHQEHGADAVIALAHETERRTYGRPLFRGTDVYLMRPIPYGIPRANLASPS
jgi:NIPSNAP